MQSALKSYTWFIQHEGTLSKVPLHPIVSTTPMDLLHLDFTSVEMTLEMNKPPKVVNILVFQDHFMKHVMVYMTPHHNCKNCHQIFIPWIYLDIWSPSQASE